MECRRAGAYWTALSVAVMMLSGCSTSKPPRALLQRQSGACVRPVRPRRMILLPGIKQRQSETRKGKTRHGCWEL